MRPDFDGVEAFFFDFDGVLADSVEVKTRAFAMLFEPYGSEIVSKVVEHHRKHGGMTRAEKFKHYFEHFLARPLDKQALQQLCRDFSSLVVDNVVAADEISGAEAFVRRCRLKASCFVVSATPDREIKEIIERRGLSRYFEDIRGSSQAKSENVRDLLKHYGLSACRCVFFGDAESDYRAASENGIHFIGILPDENAPLLQIVSSITWFSDFISLEESMAP